MNEKITKKIKIPIIINLGVLTFIASLIYPFIFWRFPESTTSNEIKDKIFLITTIIFLIAIVIDLIINIVIFNYKYSNQFNYFINKRNQNKEIKRLKLELKKLKDKNLKLEKNLKELEKSSLKFQVIREIEDD